MKLRTALVVLVACLMTTSAWAQAMTAPAGDGPKPAMIVGGQTLTPADWVEGVTGDTVELDGISMMFVGEAAREAGGSVTFEAGPEGRILNVRVGIRTMEFVVLSPGQFWRHPWVRGLMPVNELQPMPYWPYEEANIPSTPPFGVQWKRPYLQWKPDESWLLLNLEPPPEPEEEAAEMPEEPAEEEEAAEETEAADEGGPPSPPSGGMGAPSGGMGGPPGAPPAGMGAPEGAEAGMDEPPPME